MLRKNKNEKLSKHKFKKEICYKCGLCISKYTPMFCYNKFYKQNPAKFKSRLLFSLINQRLLIHIITSPNIKQRDVFNTFERIFCDSGICTTCDRSIKSRIKCVKTLRSHVTITTNKQQGRKKNNKKLIPEITTICSDNEEFLKEVDLILANNTQQPN